MTSKPSILQVLPALISGGVERGTIEIAQALNKNNTQSFVASSGGNMVVQLHAANTKHFYLPLNKKLPWALYCNSLKLARLVKDNGINIIHARSRAPAWSAYWAAQKTKTNFVTTFHGVYNFNNLAKKFYNSIMARGDRVIAVSNFVAEHIREHYKVAEDKLYVIHRGVDLDYFNPLAVKEERIVSLVHKFRIPLDRPIIVLPARLSRWKGHTVLIQALSKLDPRSYYCIIVGADGGKLSYRLELEQLINSLGLMDNISVIGPVQDMPALYMLSDIVVSASIEPEAFGRVVTEAQAMGRLVVATNIGGAKETVMDGITGWLVEPNDHVQFASTIQRLLTMSIDERNNIGTMARKHISEHFSLCRMRKATLAIYDDIIATNK
jgi:glycosyltransferase involved in cell wall biosynthesis